MAGSVSVVLSAGKPRGLVKAKCTVVVSSGGDATAAVIGSFFGRIVAIGNDGGLDNSADITLSDADTGASIIADTSGLGGGSAVYFRPTGIVTSNAGAAISASTSANDVNRDIFVAGKLKLGVANGGTSLTGIITVVVDEGR